MGSKRLIHNAISTELRSQKTMEIMVFTEVVKRTDNFSRFFASRLPNGRLFFGRIAPPRSCIEVIADFDERLDGAEMRAQLPRTLRAGRASEPKIFSKWVLER